MKIIISPAKKMNVDTDTLAPEGVPVFLEETEELLAWMRQLSWLEAKELWKCNDRIADQNYQRLQEMDLRKNLTPTGRLPLLCSPTRESSISIWRLKSLMKAR